MTVAMFHASLPAAQRKVGGVEVAVHRLANALVAQGEDVLMLSLDPPPSDALYRHAKLFPRWPWLRRWTLARWLVLPVLLNGLPLRGVTVLHLHGDDWFYLRRRVPTVRTFHGSALREGKYARRWRRKISQYAFYPMERLAARLATLPVAVGSDAAAIYAHGRRVLNGVDLDLFHPGPKTQAPTLLFVGTWEGRKRGRWLCEVFSREIRPRVPDAELWLVCDAFPDLPGVRPIRFPDDEALAALYRQAWVFAYPSVYEGFGIPYVEALASGTAIVSSPNSGARDVLADGRFGVIADDAAFGDQVVALLGDHERRRKLEEAGRQEASRYAWTVVAADHRKLYEEASRSRPGSDPAA
jgi:phosphatidylinositol alpha-mannosyltransferase